MTENQIEQLIRRMMRQMDGGYYCTAAPMNQYMIERGVSAAQAQPIYDRLITELDAASGPLPRWDSIRNQPVPGTPEP